MAVLREYSDGPAEDLPPGAPLEAMDCRQTDFQSISDELMIALGIDMPSDTINRTSTVEQITEALLPLIQAKLV